MKVIVSGSRYIEDYKVVADAIRESGFKPTLIIEGGQRRKNVRGEVVGGVDYLAKQWALAHGVPFKTERARWDLYDKAAGPIRNRVMAAMGDVLVAIPEGASRGTRDMIEAMEVLKKPVFIKAI